MLKIHQLFVRTFISIFLSILVILSILVYFWSKNVYMEQVEKNLIQNIDTLSIVLKDLNNIDVVVKDLKARIKHRITIIDEKGNVVAESDKDKDLMENHSNRIEILDAKEFGIGNSIRVSKTVNKELLYVAKKVVINKRIYFIRMSDYTNNIVDNFMKLAFQVFGLIFLFLTISFIITYLISLKIKLETDKILKFLTQLASKKPAYDLKSEFTYEFHKITKLLNKVAHRLEKKSKEKSKQNAKLKLANKQKDEIISAISHEFKNPIAIISGYSETILNDDEIPQVMKKKFLQKIMKTSHKMTYLIDKLRLSVKLDENKQELTLSNVNLKTLCEDIAEDLKENYKDRDIEIQGIEKTITADEALIAMAISNLIENALKYSDETVYVVIQHDNLTVIDNGIGINENELNQIQNKFYRVSANGWDNSLGLGLFIVNSIVKLHNFDMKITSEPEVGSKFSILY